MQHPAKANLFMIEEIVKHVSEIGDTILDIMAGTGSILVAALLDRRVVLIDVEEGYHRLQKEAVAKLTVASPEISTQATLLLGDCLAFLPLPGVDHIIFSPPYGTSMQRRKDPKADSDKYLSGSYKEGLADYSASHKNVGRMSEFLYNRTMKNIYTKCFDCLPTGGTMTIILKDHMKAGKRIRLSDWALRCCVRAGFELFEWHKRHSPGTGYLKLWKSKGYEVVEDEDIIIVRRP